MTSPASSSPSRERRRNAALRALIDELLAHVRSANHHTTAWTPEERSRAEADLELIMSRLRRAAVHDSDA